MQINGKLVYFLLSLLVAITGYTGNSMMSSLKDMQLQLNTIKDSVACLKGDFESFRGLHEYKHEVLDEKMRTFHGNGRPINPAN